MSPFLVPQSLRMWFIVHFVADIVFAIPLFFMPIWFLSWLGFTVIDPVSARLVAAALVGIGTVSLMMRNEERGVFLALLNLKIIWSAVAVIGLFWSLVEGAPRVTWVFLGIFVGFCGLWSYYRQRLA